MDEDDEEDAEALKSLVGKSAADLEAKVCFSITYWPKTPSLLQSRASNVQNVAKYSEITL